MVRQKFFLMGALVCLASCGLDSEGKGRSATSSSASSSGTGASGAEGPGGGPSSSSAGGSGATGGAGGSAGGSGGMGGAMGGAGGMGGATGGMGGSGGGMGGAGGMGGSPGPVCGDGVLDAGEQCDDMNTNAGDGCSATCQFEAIDGCPPATSISLGTTAVVVSGDSSSAADDYGATCTLGSDQGGDVVVAVTPQVTGTLVADVATGWDTRLYAWTTCNGNQLACDFGSSQSSVTFDVSAGTTYYLVVDGNNSGDDGPFTLTLTLHFCGDGKITLGEECDDGNMINGDGCSPSCDVECSPAAGATDTIQSSDNHCYHRFGAALSWQDARTACLALAPGWDLAAISSVSERNFVDNSIGTSGDVWIGGTDAMTEGTFVWVNNEPWGYAPWNNGEPNDQGGEDCVELSETFGASNDGFNDLPCTEVQAYLCELTPAGT